MERGIGPGELRALSLIICERTIIEAFTNQYSVVCTYHSIMPLAYAAVMSQLECMYVSSAVKRNQRMFTSP
jgi:hypothetical protein